MGFFKSLSRGIKKAAKYAVPVPGINPALTPPVPGMAKPGMFPGVPVPPVPGLASALRPPLGNPIEATKEAFKVVKLATSGKPAQRREALAIITRTKHLAKSGDPAARGAYRLLQAANKRQQRTGR